MNKKISIALLLIFMGLIFWFSIKGIFWYQAQGSQRAVIKAQNQAIEAVINDRRPKDSTKDADPFGEDGVARVLFIGLDTRVGQKNGHCDAIQLISIDSNAQTVEITAVPRGTYSPLPPGKAATSTDYYISNACGLGGLEYGITQIEKILGTKADYLVMVGFSETLGILRHLKLPTTETLQWLRNRHGYAIGEPQRAHNHSTFIKQMIIKFVPTKKSKVDTALHYLVYRLVKTDLSFAQAQKIKDALIDMDLANNPEKIKLSMRPLYIVQDIPYDPEHIDEYLNQTLGPIEHLLSKEDYTTESEQTVQAKLVAIIEKNKDNPEFITWAYQNNIWLQFEDEAQSLTVQYDLLLKYLALLSNTNDRQLTLADYILEMEHRNQPTWQAKAKELLKKELGY